MCGPGGSPKLWMHDDSGGLNLIQAVERRGDPEAALALYNQAVRISPDDNALVRYRRAKIFIATKRYKVSRSSLPEAICKSIKMNNAASDRGSRSTKKLITGRGERRIPAGEGVPVGWRRTEIGSTAGCSP